ncbi:MAG: PilX N-terminal domain-containing pilus assembly protein [Pseudomonadota bacterium]
MKPSRPVARRCGGTALVTALVFLLVLTLLGTFGMQQARLQERMAGQARWRAMALAAAEYTLAVAEAELAALAVDPFQPDRPGDHFYPQDLIDFDPGRPGRQQPSDRSWGFPAARIALPDLDGDGHPEPGSGMYVIQDAGSELTLDTQPAPATTPAELAGHAARAFIVTARGRSIGDVQRTVQSVYVRRPLAPTRAPDGRAGSAAAPASAQQGRRAWIDLHE